MSAEISNIKYIYILRGLKQYYHMLLNLFLTFSLLDPIFFLFRYTYIIIHISNLKYISVTQSVPYFVQGGVKGK